MTRLSNSKVDQARSTNGRGLLAHGPAARAVALAVLSHPAAFIAGAALLLALPAVLFGFPNGHDTKYHLVWHVNFASQFWGGEVYPRWLTDATWGHGGPVFFFYGPLGFHVSALASKLFAVDPLGRHAMGLAAAVALGLSGGAAYLWLRTMAGRRAAVLGAIFYMAVPYHLAIDLYLRAAYGEFWTFVWMPLVLYFIRRVRNPSIGAYVGLALSYGALMLTHLPMTLLFTPFAVAYVLTLLGWNKAALLRTSLGFATGALLSSIYVLPAMLYQDGSNANVYWGELQYAFSPSNFVERFVDPSGPVKYGSNAYVILLHCSFLLVAYVIRLCLFARPVAAVGAIREFKFCLWSSVAIFFLVTPLSTFVWDLLPIFKKVQYTWRLHAVLCLAVLPLCAFAVDAYRGLEGRRRRDAKVSFGLLAIGVLLIDFAATGHADRFDSARTDSTAAAASGLVEISLPKRVAPLITEPGEMDVSLKEHFGPRRPKAWVTQGNAEVSVARWAPRHITLQVHATEPARVAVRQLYFPGWVAHRDGACCLALVSNDSNAMLNALLLLDLPKGSYAVDLVLEKRPAERAGQAISAATLGLLVLLAAVGWWRRRGTGARRASNAPRD